MIRSIHSLRSLAFCFAWLLALHGLRGQADQIPLSNNISSELSGIGDVFWKAKSAERALEAGLYELASEYARTALQDERITDRNLRNKLRLIRADAMLATDRLSDAEAALEEIGQEPSNTSSVDLRKALIALSRKNASSASRYLESVQSSDLEGGELAWLALIHGWLDLTSGDYGGSEIEFEEAGNVAQRTAPSLYAQIGFLTFRFQLEFASDQLSLKDLEVAYERSRGSETGFRYAQLLAVSLQNENRADEAIEVLSTAFSEIPETYAEIKDGIQLLQILIAGLDSSLGQNAAKSLAIEGSDLKLRRIALQNLVSEGLNGPDGIKQIMRETLDEIIATSQGHPMTAEALYYRSIDGFQNEDHTRLEDDGKRIVNLYPDSEYNQGMLTLLASSAWQRNRFRTAASFLTQLKSRFADKLDVDRLNILIADCYFRAGDQADNEGDFSDAADAYRVALEGDLEEQEFSQIFFQLVLSHLNANEFDEAKRVLDNPELSRKSSPVEIWQAEWMLIKQMRLRQESIEAYERINSFVSLEGLSLSLQMKMLWLGSKLSYESGLYGETRTWVDRLTAVLGDLLEDVEDPEFVNQVESDALLTLAESLLKSDQIEEGLAILARVRNEFGGSESAERSYLVEARHLADQDLLVESSQLLNVLVTDNPHSKFAPLALYEIALNAEKRGQGEYLNQALELLDRITRDYPESDLVYYARLKQGNLARRLNKFETAEVVYESLENTYRDRPDRYWAQISLADTLIARASEDPSKFEAGISRLELLMDLPNVPIELRVEAGYKIGTAWETQGEKLKAKAAYWDLYDLFVLKEEGIQSLGKKGRYWLSRSMFELAEIFENESNLDTAVEFYEKIELLGLVGSELARARIEQLRGRSPVASVQ